MNAKQFVECWKLEKDHLLDVFTNPSSESAVSAKIASLNLSTKQRAALNGIVDEILVDTLYTLLLGLDGEANIGGKQVTYRIHDGKGNPISESGEIEAEAWEQFRGDKS